MIRGAQGQGGGFWSQLMDRLGSLGGVIGGGRPGFPQGGPEQMVLANQYDPDPLKGVRANPRDGDPTSIPDWFTGLWSPQYGNTMAGQTAMGGGTGTGGPGWPDPADFSGEGLDEVQRRGLPFGMGSIDPRWAAILTGGAGAVLQHAFPSRDQRLAQDKFDLEREKYESGQSAWPGHLASAMLGMRPANADAAVQPALPADLQDLAGVNRNRGRDRRRDRNRRYGDQFRAFEF